VIYHINKNYAYDLSFFHVKRFFLQLCNTAPSERCFCACGAKSDDRWVLQSPLFIQPVHK